MKYFRMEVQYSFPIPTSNLPFPNDHPISEGARSERLSLFYRNSG